MTTTMTMTSIPELHRVMARLEAVHSDTRSETGDRAGLAMHRMVLGIPNDDDLGVLLEDAQILDAAISQAAADRRRRSEQLHDAPALRLAADVVMARSAHETRVALGALRDLAGKGRLQVDGGSVRVPADQMGFARLLLRHLALRLSNAKATHGSDAVMTGQ